MFINVGHTSLVEKHENEFKCLSRVAKYVLCVPITNVNTENVAIASNKRALDQFQPCKCWHCSTPEQHSVDAIGRRFNLATHWMLWFANLSKEKRIWMSSRNNCEWFDFLRDFDSYCLPKTVPLTPYKSGIQYLFTVHSFKDCCHLEI